MDLEEAQLSIIEKIAKAKYPSDHPFTNELFINDFYCKALSIFLMFSKEEDIIDDLITKKLKGNNSGKFDRLKFEEGMSEFNVLYYIFVRIINPNYIPSINLKKINYEPPSDDGLKTLEYELLITHNNNNLKISIEVKTIETMPEIREKIHIQAGKKYLKPYFKDVKIDFLKSRPDHNEIQILENSTHARQISKHIKKISDKFHNSSSNLNIGFIAFQNATSMEEIFPTLFHPTLGIHTRNPNIFRNIDCLVIFSMTATPDLLLNDIYERDHILSMCLTSEQWKIDVIKKIKLDNFIFKDENISEWVKPFTNEEYGIFEYKLHNKLLFFMNENSNVTEIEQIAEEIGNKLKPV